MFLFISIMFGNYRVMCTTIPQVQNKDDDDDDFDVGRFVYLHVFISL